MLTTSASPTRTLRVGKYYNLSKAEAESLVRGEQILEFDETAKAYVPAVRNGKPVMNGPFAEYARGPVKVLPIQYNGRDESPVDDD